MGFYQLRFATPARETLDLLDDSPQYAAKLRKVRRALGCCKSTPVTQGYTRISTRISPAPRRRRCGTPMWKIARPGRGGFGGCTGRMRSAIIKPSR